MISLRRSIAARLRAWNRGCTALATLIALGLAPNALPAGAPRHGTQPVPKAVVPRYFESAGTRSTPLPGLAFVENRGQWKTSARFVSKRRGAVLRADPEGLWIELMRMDAACEERERLVLKMSFVDAAPNATIEGVGMTEARQHFFLGNDPARWQTDLAVFAGLRWKAVWPGIDLELLPGGEHELFRYEAHVAPGADLNQLAIRVDGCERLATSASGELLAATVFGPLTQTPPRAFEDQEGASTIEIPVAFECRSTTVFGFTAPSRSVTRALRIDPGLHWATFLGGSQDDLPLASVLDALDRPIVTGRTYSLDFPTTPGAMQPLKGGDFDVFVSKFRADGSALLFSSYLGGVEYDQGDTIALDTNAAIVVGGRTFSPTFPVTPGAYDTSLDNTDGFLLKLSPDGSSVLASTLLGGPGGQTLLQLALAQNGDYFVAGETSGSIPVTPGAALQTACASTNGYVARLSGDLSTLEWATYLCGNSADNMRGGIAATPDGGVVVAGWTQSHDFPSTPGAADPVFEATAGAAAFISKFNATGTALVYSTFLSGTFGTRFYSIALDSNGRVAATGSGDGIAVTPGSLDTVPSQFNGDAILVILSADGSTYEYATYLGNQTFDANGESAIDFSDSGVITVLACTEHEWFPITPGAYDSQIGIGGPDFYVTQVDPSGSKVLYASYLGNAPGGDYLFGGGLDSKGRAVFVGSHCCGDFPVTPGAFDPTFGGYGPAPFFYGDGVLAKLELQPLGVGGFGASTDACNGKIHLTALGEPKAGNGTFRIACAGAPPSAPGAVLISGASIPAGLPILGVTLYVDLAGPVLMLPAVADALGYRETAAALPISAAGITLYAQAGWLDTGGCGGTLAFSASDALAIQVSP